MGSIENSLGIWCHVIFMDINSDPAIEIASMIHYPLVAQTVKYLPTMQETWVQSLGREDPLEKGMATHSSTLAWKIPWEEPGPWGRKESDMTERLHFNLIEIASMIHLLIFF